MPFWESIAKNLLQKVKEEKLIEEREKLLVRDRQAEDNEYDAKIKYYEEQVAA